MDFIHDDRVHGAEIASCFARCEQKIQRLRRRDEDVRRLFEHGRAILHRRVASADTGADLRAEIASCQGELLNLREWAVKVLLNIVGQRLQRRDVHDLCARSEAALQCLAQQAIDADKKCCKGFARSSGRGDERAFAAQDDGPACPLRLGGCAELRREPLRDDGVCPRERGIDVEIGRDGETRGHVCDSTPGFAICSLQGQAPSTARAPYDESDGLSDQDLRCVF